MLRRLVVGGLAGLCALSSSCSFEESKQRAEPCAARFHENFTAERFHQIYAEGDAALQGSATEGDTARMLTAVHRRLGGVKRSELTGWNVNTQLGGNSTVTLAYTTEFERAPGTETLTVAVEGKQCRLQGFRITSPALSIE
jgi:hypothetical protein